jgi:hypothetical protein
MIPRYKRMKRRDWKDPFSWFNWYFMARRTEMWEYANLVTSTGAFFKTDTGLQVVAASIPELS